MGWSFNFIGTASAVLASCTAVVNLPAAVLTLITSFCNAATGNVSAKSAGNPNGYTLELSQSPPVAGISGEA